jgi:hypothetical protein
MLFGKMTFHGDMAIPLSTKVGLSPAISTILSVDFHFANKTPLVRLSCVSLRGNDRRYILLADLKSGKSIDWGQKLESF